MSVEVVCLVSAEEASTAWSQQTHIFGLIEIVTFIAQTDEQFGALGWRACAAVTTNNALLHAVIAGACPSL